MNMLIMKWQARIITSLVQHILVLNAIPHALATSAVLVQPCSVCKHARLLLALDYCIYSASLLSATTVMVAPATFTTHALLTISLTLMMQNLAHASTSPICNNPWLDHHSNGSCWDGGLMWLTLTCNPSSLAASRIRQKVPHQLPIDDPVSSGFRGAFL